MTLQVLFSAELVLADTASESFRSSGSVASYICRSRGSGFIWGTQRNERHLEKKRRKWTGKREIYGLKNLGNV